MVTIVNSVLGIFDIIAILVMSRTIVIVGSLMALRTMPNGSLGHCRCHEDKSENYDALHVVAAGAAGAAAAAVVVVVVPDVGTRLG
jgi:hypothetical protein